MALDGKYLGLGPLLVLYLALSANGALPATLNGNDVKVTLERVRDRGRTFFPDLGKGAQLASMLALNTQLQELVFDSTPYIPEHDIHSEQFLLEMSPNVFAIPSEGYLFLHTHFSPCAQGCITTINIFAHDNPNLRMYIGFQRFYGNGDITATNEVRQMFFVHSLETQPSNVKYMYIPKSGSASWVTKDGLRQV